MEYCEKDTLRQLIDSGILHTSEDKVWRLFREIAEGLEHIHSKVRVIQVVFGYQQRRLSEMKTLHLISNFEQKPLSNA